MSFRDRLNPALTELRTLRLFPYGSARDLARLDCNELPFPPEPELLLQIGAKLESLALHRYPEVSGESLRRALAARWGVEPDEILLGNGSIEVLATLLSALAGPRIEAAVLYPDPSFPHYEVLAKSHGLRPIAIPLEADFQLDEATFADAIDRHRPAIAIFASPNNPTGNVFEPSVLERLARRGDGAFVVDEAYIDFARRGSEQSLLPRIRDIPGLFVTRTLSKIGYAGLRVGALIGARDAIAELDKIRLPWNVNAFSLALAESLVLRPEWFERRVQAALKLRSSLEAALRAIPGVTVFPSEANFVLIRLPTEAAALVSRLAERGVIVKNVARPGLLERCIRISIGTEADNARCVAALHAALGA